MPTSVAVKPLVWHEDRGGIPALPPDYWADTPFGAYYLTPTNPSHTLPVIYTTKFGQQPLSSRSTDIDRLKAAIQRDFEARVKQCLQPE